jgi:hypothetical protein
MNEQSMNEMSCEEFREIGAELALDVADARERARAVAHLEHCPGCRIELRQLSDVADTLTALIPAVEPPAGFESRLLARVEGDKQRHHGRTSRRRTWWAAAAAAVAAVAIGAGGWVIGEQTSPSPAVAAGHVVTAKLAADHQPVGLVVIETGPDPWLSMAVSIGRGDAKVQCQLRASDGRVISVGWFNLWQGNGYWAAPITAASESLVAAQIVDEHGRVLASAALPAVKLDAAGASDATA